MKKLVVLVSGGGSNLQALIDAIEQKIIPAEIVKVISNKKDAYGLTRAQNHGIETEVIQDLSKLLELDVDGIVCAGFLKILPKDVVNHFENKIINVHPSLIPSFAGKGFYGMRVHEAVYQKGVKFTGCTTHFVNEHADEGPIIFQEIVSISQDDTPETIAQKVLEKEHQCIVETVKNFCEDKLEVNQGKVNIL